MLLCFEPEVTSDRDKRARSMEFAWPKLSELHLTCFLLIIFSIFILPSSVLLPHLDFISNRFLCAPSPLLSSPSLPLPRLPAFFDSSRFVFLPSQFVVTGNFTVFVLPRFASFRFASFDFRPAAFCLLPLPCVFSVDVCISLFIFHIQSPVLWFISSALLLSKCRNLSNYSFSV